MKRMLVILVLCLAFGSAVLSAPNIVMYRYQGKGFVSDNAKWLAGKKVAFLIHGFSNFSQGKCRDGMVGLAAHLSVSRKVGETTIPGYDAVYAVEYPAKYHILDTAAALSSIVNSKCSNWPIDQKIDVFAHSMGGLITRTAIEYPEVLLGTKNISNRVGHLVTMSTPHNGISSPEADIFKEAFGELPVEVGDMDPKGLFMNMLNFASTKKPQVLCDYYSIVGARSYRPKKYLDGKTGFLATIVKKLQDISYPVHDGLIDATSAGYDLKEVCHAFKKAQLDLNHDYIKSHSEVFEVIDNWMVEDSWFGAAIAKEDTPVLVGPITKTNGLPITIVRTRAEAERVYGKPDSILTDNIVVYHNHFDKNYEMWISYLPNYAPTPKWNQWQQYDKVCVMVYEYIESKERKLIRPDQFVPGEILKNKPFGVYRSVLPNTIVMIWYIKGATYVLAVNDDPKRPLYTTVKTKKWDKYVQNKNTLDFTRDGVYHFAYTSKIEKLTPGYNIYSGEPNLQINIYNMAHSGFVLWPIVKR